MLNTHSIKPLIACTTMNSNSEPTGKGKGKGTSSSGRPPRGPNKAAAAVLPKYTPAAAGDDAAAEARRAERSRVLDSFHRKQEMLRIERGGSRRSLSSASSASTSTILTRSKSQAKQQEDSGSFKLLSPDKFAAYREKIGYVAPIPVGTVNLTAKSPASTIGGCSSLASAALLSPAQDVEYAEAESAVKFFDKNSITNKDDAVKENVVNKSSSKKKKERTQPSNVILREMRRAAAFDAQSYVFSNYEKVSKEQREVAISEQFHGAIIPQHIDDRQLPGGLKGTLAQLINGDSAYAVLYDEADVIGSSRELILKKRLCGTESSSRYVAGQHFNEKLVAEFGMKKRSAKISGRSLWDLALATMKSLKKAMAFVRKLDNIIVEVDANSNRVIGYMSGKNEDSFFQAIINGMWQLEQSKKKKKRVAIDDGKNVNITIFL